MAVYSVFVRSSAERELTAIPKHDLRKIKTKLLALAENPTPPGCTKLVGEKLYRLRQGDWRIVYEVDYPMKRVEIVKIGHRREIYR
jgi:mRNA interferase RelE/StbE